jgi:hypothetical protein
MPYRNGDRVCVATSELTAIPRQHATPPEAEGVVLQRCGPEAYDVLLDEPIAPELSLLSWVPERLLRPAQGAAR